MSPLIPIVKFLAVTRKLLPLRLTVGDSESSLRASAPYNPGNGNLDLFGADQTPPAPFLVFDKAGT